MSDELSCGETRSVLFEFYRGELSELKRAEVEKHLRECRECGEIVEKIREMFGTAAEADAATWAELDPDRLFERIEAEIDDETTGGKPDADARLEGLFEATRQADQETWTGSDPDALFDRISDRIEQADSPPADAGEPVSGDRGEDDEQSSGEPLERHDSGSTSWRRRVVGAVAAAVCVVAAGWWLYSSQGLDWSTPESGAPTDGTAGETARAGGIDSSGEDSSPLVSLSEMEQVESGHEATRLFADRDAEYEVDGGSREPGVELSEGSILVEYRPGDETGFSVRARSHTVSVTGTVFSVEIRDDTPRISVFEGSVRVERPDGSLRRLEAGRFIAGDRDSALGAESRSQVERYIDLDAHRGMIREGFEEATRESERQLRAAIDVAGRRIEEHETTDGAEEVRKPGDSAVDPGASNRPSDDRTPDPEEEPTEEEGATSARQLHQSALEALRGREPRRAADLLERALEKTEPTDRARADILLELARIHLRQLEEPERAADYLADFVDRWPDDPAASAIRRRLCEMDIEDVDDAVCD